MNFSDLYPSPEGLWRPVLLAAGVSPAHLAMGVPCPFPGCGGDDRFIYGDNGVGSFYCRVCKRKGNGYDFIGFLFGLGEFSEKREKVQQLLRGLPADVRAQAAAPAARNRRGTVDPKHVADRHEIWEERSRPIRPDDPVGRYLMQRVGFIPKTDALRTFPDKFTTWMAARATHPVAWGTLHFTDMNLEAELRKRTSEGVRPSGSSVRLMPMDDRKILGVAEGIETALSASVLFDVPVWAALDANGLENFLPPAHAVALMIFADNDEHGASLEAAKALQARCEIPSEIHMPEKVGEDWNDVHNRR